MYFSDINGIKSFNLNDFKYIGLVTHIQYTINNTIIDNRVVDILTVL
jgi:hypothetical protein